jgi:hypothetical protein
LRSVNPFAFALIKRIYKREELKILLRDKSIDLLGITESWAHDGIDDSELTFEGYVMFRKDRKNPLKGKGGGVILYVKEFLCAVMMLDDTIYLCESLWVKIMDKAKNEIYIGLCYLVSRCRPHRNRCYVQTD